MAGKSPRDKCFGDAVKAWNDTHANDQLPIESQKPWVLDGGTWRPAGMLDNIWSYIRSTTPYRIPDWTATINGKPVAGDNKFSGDGFSNRTGRSGKTQLEDQNDMNSHQSPGNSDYQDLNLNPETCKCDGEPKREQVYEYAPALGRGPVFVPVIPSPGTVPVIPPITVPEFGLPEFGLPEFVFP